MSRSGGAKAADIELQDLSQRLLDNREEPSTVFNSVAASDEVASSGSQYDAVSLNANTKDDEPSPPRSNYDNENLVESLQARREALAAAAAAVAATVESRQLTALTMAEARELESERLVLAETNLDDIRHVDFATSPITDLGAAESLIDEYKSHNVRSRQSTRIRDYLAANNLDDLLLKPSLVKLIFVLFILLVLFLVIALPYSLFTIEYDQIALARNTWTGSVDDKVVYKSGLHLLMPWKEWILFDRTAHSIQIDRLRIFTTDKLEVNAWFQLFYFIDVENLGRLYRKFNTDYRELIASVCRSELMNLGQTFSIDDYRTRRIHVRQFLKEKLKTRLAHDYSLVLFDIYLEQLAFDAVIDNLNLLRMLNGIFNERALYEKRREMAIAETELATRQIRNKADLILTTAELMANNTIVKIGRIDYECKREEQYASSMSTNLVALDFYTAAATNRAQTVRNQTQTKRAMSFCLWTSLAANENMRFHSSSQYQTNLGPSNKPTTDLLAGLVAGMVNI